MTKDFKKIGNDLIPDPELSNNIRYEDGNTEDIIETIIYADKASNFKASREMKSVSEQLLDDDIMKTLYNVWAFVKSQIKYNADKLGHEKIKSPARLWHDKSGDCKSFSLMVGSILRNYKNIGYSYRFVMYPRQSDYSHVYVIAHLRNKNVIIDSVHTAFNSEVPFLKKLDIKMTKISHLTGIPAYNKGALPSRNERFQDAPKRATRVPDLPVSKLSEGELRLSLINQSLEIDKAYFGDPTGELIKAQNLLFKVQKEGLNNVGSIVGHIGSGLVAEVARHILIAKAMNHPSIAGPNPNEAYFDKDCAAKFPLTKKKESGSGPVFGGGVDLFPYSAADPNYQKYMDCYRTKNQERLLFNTDQFIKGSHHMLYEFLEKKGGATVDTKKVFHYNAVTAWANVSGISRENTRLYVANGIKQRSAENKLPDLSPLYNIELLSMVKDGKGQIPGINLDPVTIAAATKLISMIVGAVTAIVAAINQLKAINQASLRAQAQGIGAPGFGPEWQDWKDELDSLEKTNSLIPLALLAAGGYVVLSK